MEIRWDQVTSSRAGAIETQLRQQIGEFSQAHGMQRTMMIHDVPMAITIFCHDVPCIQHWQFELPCFVGFSWIYRSLGMISPANHRVATGTRSNRIPSGRLWSCEADSKCAGLRRQHAQSTLISSSFIFSRALNVNLNDIIHDFNIF